LLLPGAYVTVLYNEKLKDAILIERGFIQMQQSDNYVFILKDGIIEKRVVELGDFVGNKVIIKKGLNVSDELITTPLSPNDIGGKAVVLMEKNE